MVRGIQIDKYKLTPEGRIAVWIAICEENGEEFTTKRAFRLATKGKDFLQFIVACICMAVCVPIGICWRLIR